MKIVIAGGATESEFLAEMLIRKGHTTVFIAKHGEIEPPARRFRASRAL